MIRGSGRLNKRMDERAAFLTPGGDAVRDGRHLMTQEAPSASATGVLEPLEQLEPGEVAVAAADPVGLQPAQVERQDVALDAEQLGDAHRVGVYR